MGRELASPLRDDEAVWLDADRVGQVRGNVGPQALGQIRETLALIFDLPG